VPALIVATFQATIVLGVGIWAYQIPFAGSLLLFYFTMVIYGLSLVGFGLLISAVLDAAGVYRRVRLYDAGDFALRLCFTGGEHAGVAAGSDVDKPDPPLYGYHQADLSEGCESGDCLGKFVAATGHSGHDGLSGVCDV
jgi:hypothetical protein